MAENETPQPQAGYAEVEALMENGAWATVRARLLPWDAPAIAELLDGLPEDRLPDAFRCVPEDRRAAVFGLVEPGRASIILDDLSDKEAVPILAGMRPDDLTALLEDAGPITHRRVLSLLEPEDRQKALDLLGYPEESVGRLMTPDFVAVRPHWSVARAMEHIRHRGRDSETLHTLYVTDREGRLVDDLRLRTLILADPEKPVQEFLDGSYMCLEATADREHAVQAMQRYDVFVLPVVDNKGMLLGVVTVDDVLDVQEEEATEDFHMAAAVQPLAAGYRDTTVPQLVRARTPWLVVLVFVALLSSGVIHAYEETLLAYSALALFIPMLIGTGGNTGSQSATIMVRALATGDVRVREWLQVMGKELLVGLSIGVVLGLASGLVGHLRGGADIAIVVALSMFGVVLVANIVGMLLPFVFTRIRIDPAMASSPLLATIMDAIGLLIYFTIAASLLGRLAG